MNERRKSLLRTIGISSASVGLLTGLALYTYPKYFDSNPLENREKAISSHSETVVEERCIHDKYSDGTFFAIEIPIGGSNANLRKIYKYTHSACDEESQAIQPRFSFYMRSNFEETFGPEETVALDIKALEDIMGGESKIEIYSPIRDLIEKN